METLNQLQEIFNEIQNCDSKRFNENMLKTLSIIPIDNSFLRIIDCILVYSKNSPPPKVIHFIRRILEELKETNNDIFNIISLYLLEMTQCKRAKIRRNALKLIQLILLIQNGCNDNDYLAKIAEKLFDKDTSVRKEALKICLSFQSHRLSDSLTIQTAIKDMIRYDTSQEIRKIGFLGLELNESTLNCILERCIDSSAAIRKAFWTEYFPKIDLKSLNYTQRIYLMKKGINEREFNAKDIFLEKIRTYGLNQFIEDFYSEDHEYNVCIEAYLTNNEEKYELDRYTPSYLYFLNCYYKITEDKYGRDSLNLLPLDEFLQIFHLKCVELEKLDKNTDEAKNQFQILKYFIKILGFYDFFTDDSKKYIISIVNYIILSCNFVPVVEECVILLVKTCSENLIKILGSLIKKTRGKTICFSICEAVMKHLELCEMHNAILSEIAILDIEQSVNIFFWYYMKNPNPNIEEQYLSMLPNKKVIEGCTDLVLRNILDVSKIEECLLTQISRFNQSCVIPICKLLLGKKISSTEYIKYLLLIYYSTEVESIQQYLSLFFYEYFKNNPEALINIFCDVLELITANHKIFVDQALFWISNSQDSLKYQLLYFNICVSIQNRYETLVNKKYCFLALSLIPIEPTWDKIITKKIITVFGLIIRKRPRENVNVLLNQLVEIDDGAPLLIEDYNDLKVHITNIN